MEESTGKWAIDSWIHVCFKTVLRNPNCIKELTAIATAGGDSYELHDSTLEPQTQGKLL